MAEHGGKKERRWTCEDSEPVRELIKGMAALFTQPETEWDNVITGSESEHLSPALTLWVFPRTRRRDGNNGNMTRRKRGIWGRREAKRKRGLKKERNDVEKKRLKEKGNERNQRETNESRREIRTNIRTRKEKKRKERI